MAAEATILGSLAIAAAKKAGELTATKVWEVISPLGQAKTNSKKPTGFDDALELFTTYSFDKCTKIKTLINRDKPVDLLKIFIELEFSQKPKSKEKKIDQYDLIEKIYGGGRLTICGTGGSGKSMFMRYLYQRSFAATHMGPFA